MGVSRTNHTHTGSGKLGTRPATCKVARAIMSTAKTTFGPFQRLTILTNNAVVTVTGSNVLASFSFHEQKAGHRGFPPLSAVQCVNEVEKFGEDSAAVGTNREGFFDLTEPDASSEESSGNSDVEESWSQVDAHVGNMESTLCAPDIPATSTSDSDGSSRSERDQQCSSVGMSDAKITDSFPVSPSESPSQSVPEQEAVEELAKSPPAASSSPDSGGEMTGIDCTHKYSSSKSSTLSGKLQSRLRSRARVKRSTYDKSSTLGRDLHSHSRKKPFSCDTCAKTFSNHSYLASHIRTHTGEKPFSCDTCGKSFSHSSNLTSHLRTHTGVKPYSCDTCGKTFSYHSNLASHIRTHTGEKPFSCDMCGKSFSQSSNLTSHLRTHTGEKPFSCDTCGKSFPRCNDLVCHVRTHTGEKPFSCDKCGKSFLRSNDLVRHLRTHTGEKPYSCDTCGKAFSDSGHLARHLRTHTGEKPFSCDVCGKSFSTSSNLAAHLRTHTRRSHVTRMANLLPIWQFSGSPSHSHWRETILM